MSGLLVGIMGAGQMAQGFDKPGDAHVLSLAHAVSASSSLRLGGFYDRSVERARAAEAKWGCPETPRDRAEWLRQPWDIVCIATPDERHADDLRDVLACRPKAVLVEKPLATDAAKGSCLLKEAAAAGIPVLVDFPRRFHSGVSAVSRLIEDGKVGAPIASTFVYSGEASHSASHMLDLFHAWWGGGWSAELKGRHGSTTLIELSRGTGRVAATFISMPASAYYVWEMRLYCASGKIELSNNPETLTVDLLAPHPLYPSFTVLTHKHTFAMEGEPLLNRTFESLNAIASNQADGLRQLAREAESQAFSGQLLAVLEGRRA
ncbi:Gfo/Idh/MocA family protein [Rhodoplanes sp. Z2-YC6860]|uniref:Gfo/Idh/MocA family protein n=1 Tax=Rhodoplanes sp. Z2-YC6860 TaxID=674703 RepID=UPI00078E0BEA|nr:Gfo/Idh/MocA family oxidoreductase [Rhodoplanes sp. Z2-YC6860]AMN43451.1 oxidoreductase [Rhodoplanes sp. Z2-YC6860]